MIINPYVFATGAANQPYTDAFLTASGITDVTIIAASNQYEIDLTGYGLIDFGNPSANRIHALYLFFGTTAGEHKWNFLDPQDTNAAFRLSFVGGNTHAATGWLPDGTTGYADTFLFPGTTLDPNSFGLSFYSRTDFTSVPDKNLWGMVDGNFVMWDNYSSPNKAYVALGNASFVDLACTPTTGLMTAVRTTANDVELYKNAVSIGTGVSAVGALPATRSLFVQALNVGSAANFAPYECCFFAIHKGLTPTEVANFYTATQTLQTALTRQV